MSLILLIYQQHLHGTLLLILAFKTDNVFFIKMRQKERMAKKTCVKTKHESKTVSIWNDAIMYSV